MRRVRHKPATPLCPRLQANGIVGDPRPTVIDATTYVDVPSNKSSNDPEDGSGGGLETAPENGSHSALLAGWEAVLDQCSRARRPLIIRNLGTATDWEAYKWDFDEPFGAELGETQVKVRGEWRAEVC